MASRKNIFKEIFEVYELGNETDNKLHNVRYYIRKKFEATYLDKEWLELTEYEKNRFIYITIRTDMFERYIDVSKHNRLNIKLDRFIDKNFLDTDVVIHEYNDNLSEVFSVFYCQNDTADKMKGNYEKFCSVLSEYNAKVLAPTYDEWLELNQIAPMRVYDYCKSYYADNEAMGGSKKYIASQAEVDHVTLQTLLKLMEKKFDIKVDIDLIDESITYIKNYQIEEDEQLLVEYDSSLNISKEEQEEIIKADQKYMYYKKKLEAFDFLK